MQFNLIVAVCRNNGIGYKGNIPWHIKADLQYFSKLTKGNGRNAIVMGNNTWKSLPSQYSLGLPGRDNFVLSRSASLDERLDKDNRLVKSFETVEDFSEFSKKKNYEEVWIIGGAQIYKTFLDKNLNKKCYITYIDKDFECDTFLPELERSKWSEIESRDEYDIKYNCYVRYVVYDVITCDPL
jgi:dihydrofolate reductase